MAGLMRKIDIPPTWLALFLGIAWGAHQLAPLGWLAPAPWIGGAVIAGGVMLAVWAALVMLRSRTPVFPRRTPQNIVTRGPYAFSRNPIYLADAVILLGFSASLGSAWPALLTPLFMLLIQKRFIDGEEAALREAFPLEWEAWSERTRRWL